MNLLAYVPLDKVGHFIAGLIVSTVSLGIVVLGFNTPLVPLISAALAGGLKEAYDSFHQDRHTVDFWDFVATTAGCLPVVLTMLITYGT